MIQHAQVQTLQTAVNLIWQNINDSACTNSESFEESSVSKCRTCWICKISMHYIRKWIWYDMIILQTIRSSQIKEFLSVLEKWKLLSPSCIHYPNDYSSKEEGKNDITIVPFASSSSLLDFGWQCKNSIFRAAPKSMCDECLSRLD